jgi:aminoglycoside/choline kinase family phosphotransferase
MLMHAPPPHEDPRPFVAVDDYLREHGLRAPEILAQDVDNGFLLIEDFGDTRLRDHLDIAPEDEAALYQEAVDALVQLHRCPPGDFDAYDLPTYLREVGLLTEWYAPLVGIEPNEQAYVAAWTQVLEPLVKRQGAGVSVLRDYHAENIMLLAEGGQGLIDFQDALVGHPAYDLVSLLQDARRDVLPELEARMIAHYCASAEAGDDFAGDYAILGAQRNAKIVGIFCRLFKRDGKPRYLAMIPRVWDALERDLAHPALAPVAAWFDANIPHALRVARGGDLEALA